MMALPSFPPTLFMALRLRRGRKKQLSGRMKTLAFRVSKKKNLLNLIKKTGPLISTSANPEGQKPAETIAEAKKYFGGEIDFYVSGGKMKSLPSTLVEIKNGNVRVIRKGVLKIPKALMKK